MNKSLMMKSLMSVTALMLVVGFQNCSKVDFAAAKNSAQKSFVEGGGDADEDGIPNSEDTDIDGDGTPNGGDEDVDGDGTPNGDDRDIDEDGKPNESDPDMDGDGTPNIMDPDADGDGIPGDEDSTPNGPPPGSEDDGEEEGDDGDDVRCIGNGIKVPESTVVACSDGDLKCIQLCSGGKNIIATFKQGRSLIPAGAKPGKCN